MGSEEGIDSLWRGYLKVACDDARRALYLRMTRVNGLVLAIRDVCWQLARLVLAITFGGRAGRVIEYGSG